MRWNWALAFGASALLSACSGSPSSTAAGVPTASAAGPGAVTSSQAMSPPGTPITRRLCDQDVTYSLLPPPAGVSADARAFLGVWLGTWNSVWNNALCTALIVESVTATGQATIVYLQAGQTEIGPLRLTVQISGKTLSFGTTLLMYEYTLQSSNTLAAYRTTYWGPEHGQVTRVN